MWLHRLPLCNSYAKTSVAEDSCSVDASMMGKDCLSSPSKRKQDKSPYVVKRHRYVLKYSACYC